MIKPVLFEYDCASCGRSFLSPGLPDQAYGLLLFRTNKGEVALLEAFKDKAFEEFEHLFDQVKKKFSWIDKTNDTKIFQSSFNVSADLSPSGNVYDISEEPMCPYCGSRHMASWIQTDPLQVGEKDLPVITHENWNRLSIEEKKALIEKGIQEYLDKHIGQ